MKKFRLRHSESGKSCDIERLSKRMLEFLVALAEREIESEPRRNKVIEASIRARLPKHVILRQILIYTYFSALLRTNQDTQKTSDKDRYYPICSDKDTEKVTKWGNQNGNQITIVNN